MTTTHSVPNTRHVRVQRTPTPPSAGTWWVRVAALAGAAFFGLIVAVGTLTSGAPAAADPATDVVAFLRDHQSQLQVAAGLLALAMPAALLFLSALYAALVKAEAGTGRLAVAALGGGVLAAASTVGSALLLGATAARFSDLGPATTHFFWSMWLMSIASVLLGQLLLVGATSAVSLRTGLFPRWFGVAGVVLVLASVVGTFAIGYTLTWVQVVAGIAVLLNSVWILVVSAYLWRRPTLAVA